MSSLPLDRVPTYNSTVPCRSHASQQQCGPAEEEFNIHALTKDSTFVHLFHNSSINQPLITPIIPLQPLSIHRSITLVSTRPKSRTRNIEVPPRIPHDLKNTLPPLQLISKCRFDGPLTHEHWELAITECGGGLCADQRSYIGGVGLFPIVVDVGIDDEVFGRGEEGGPEGYAFPAVLEHYGDVRVGGFDQGDYLLDVMGHPCRAIVREGGGLT